MENVFKKFNEDFFKSVKDITWYDKDGFMKLDKERMIRITLNDQRTSNHFCSYKVEILNKVQGTIIIKVFSFKDHLTMNHRDTQEYYHVWYDMGKLNWYISLPKDTKEMVKVIMDFINSFKIN